MAIELQRTSRHTYAAVLLDAVATTTDGEWVEVTGLLPISVDLRGINGDTVHLCISNAESRPANNTHGQEYTDDPLAADTFIRINDLPVRWLKVRVSARVAGTITAIMHGERPQ